VVEGIWTVFKTSGRDSPYQWGKFPHSPSERIVYTGGEIISKILPPHVFLAMVVTENILSETELNANSKLILM